jgi:hypothetical protein
MKTNELKDATTRGMNLEKENAGKMKSSHKQTIGYILEPELFVKMAKMGLIV